MRIGLLPIGIALALGDLAYAVRFSVVGRRSLDKRGNAFGVSTLNNSHDFKYYTAIQLGGQVFTQVLIDTGRYVDPPYYAPSPSPYQVTCDL
jgi:hypothetical protein